MCGRRFDILCVLMWSRPRCARVGWCQRGASALPRFLGGGELWHAIREIGRLTKRQAADAAWGGRGGGARSSCPRAVRRARTLLHSLAHACPWTPSTHQLAPAGLAPQAARACLILALISGRKSFWRACPLTCFFKNTPRFSLVFLLRGLPAGFLAVLLRGFPRKGFRNKNQYSGFPSARTF